MVEGNFLLSVIYVSVADPELDRDALAALVVAAQQKNSAAGLTGLLLYNGINFLQALEGEAAAVESCLARIGADARHNGMIEVARQSPTAREFAGFDMLYNPYFRPDERAFAQLEEKCQMGPQTKRIIGSFLALGGG